MSLTVPAVSLYKL